MSLPGIQLQLLLRVVTLTVVLVCLLGCKKPQAARPDPHSPEAALAAMLQQAKLLNEAASRNDLTYVHDYTYYFSTLAKSLASKLNDEERKSLGNLFEQLSNLTEQLDMASGRKHLEATQASLTQLLATLKELQTRYSAMKHPNG